MTWPQERLGSYIAVVEAVKRYGTAADSHDFDALRALFTDDAAMLLPHRDPVTGGDEIVDFVRTYTGDRDWSHHVISVCRVEFSSDEAATAFSNVTSHHTLAGVPDRVGQLCGRYIDQLRLVDGAWRIASKRVHVGWREEREFTQDMAHLDDRRVAR